MFVCVGGGGRVVGITEGEISIHGFRKLKVTTCKRAGYQWRCSTCCEAEWKGLGRSIESRCTSLRAGLARRLVVMVTDVGIVPFLYCLRQSLFNAVVLGIYSNILLGLGPLRKQFLATYIKDLFLGKMLRSNKSRKWMNHGKPVCHPDDVIFVIENWFV